MQAPLELMWDALKQKDFSKAKSHIENNPEVDLVNSLQPDNGRTLAIYLVQSTINRKEVKPRDLLSLVLTNPTMNWGAPYKRVTAANALIDAAYADGDLSVIEALNGVGGFVLSNEQFTYDYAVKELKLVEKLMQQKINNGKPQNERDSVQASINKWKKIVALVRDITILHAIKTDNAALMARLDQSGGEPLEKLGEFGCNQRSGFLIGKDQPNPAIKAWRTEKLERNIAGRQESMKKTAENLKKLSIFTENAARINAEHDAKKIEILEKAAKDRESRMHRAIK